MLFPRAADWISIFAFGGLVLLSWRQKLDRVRRAKIAALGASGIAVTVFVSLLLPLVAPPAIVAPIRDWMPCSLLLLFYSQAGQFVTRVDVAVEARLARLDQWCLAPFLQWCSKRRLGIFILAALEAAYFSYYVAIPLAVGALYWFGQQGKAGHFWPVVLLAAYGSCGMLPFVQTRPPRMLGEKWSACLPHGKVRAFNLWILRHGSIQANTIPSAHVAITAACGFALLQAGLFWVGLAFLTGAIGIAMGAVAGRYHYTVDVVLGFVCAGLALGIAGLLG